MSKESEISAKAELNKHINSKLFQKFLSKEAARLPDPLPAKPMPKSSLRKSPIRIERSSNLESPPKTLNKTISQKLVSNNFQDISPVQFRDKSLIRRKSPEENQTFDFRRSHYDSPDVPRNWKPAEEPASFIPIYTADPLLLKQLESDKLSLQVELKKAQERFDTMLKKKTEDLKRLQKQLDNARISNEELMGKLNQVEDAERKLNSLKSERDILDRKVHTLEAECESYRRQIEYAKESAEAYKGQIEECERSNRNKGQDVERELRTAKDWVDDLERQLSREKERSQNLERKLKKAKDSIFAGQSELTRAEERNRRLERDLQEAKERLSSESSQQLRETEVLRRKIEDLTMEIAKKDRSEEYRKENFEALKEKSDWFHSSARDSDRKREYDSRRDTRGNYEPRREPEHYRTYEPRREETKRQPSERRSEPSAWHKNETSPRGRNHDNLRGLEGKLMALQMDKKRLEDELSKIPMTGRRIAQIKRKEEIDLELQILDSNISTVKIKLRQANAL